MNNKIKIFCIFIYGIIITLGKLPFVLLVVILTWALAFAIYMAHDKNINERTFK